MEQVLHPVLLYAIARQPFAPERSSSYSIREAEENHGNRRQRRSTTTNSSLTGKPTRPSAFVHFPTPFRKCAFLLPPLPLLSLGMPTREIKLTH